VERFIENLRAAGAPFGLNLIAAVPIRVYLEQTRSARPPSFAPQMRSIVVVANGGGDFWRAFSRYRDAHPGWDERQNPLDDFTRIVTEQHLLQVAHAEGIDCAAAYPFVTQPVTVNFMALGRAAGVAGPSLLGVLVHPTYGPWIAFRAALLLDRELDAPGDARAFDPCPGCVTRSCISACPAAAVSYPQGWDIPRCLCYRVENEAACAPVCHARAACVLGPEHRYPPDALAYHQRRALQAMRPYYDQVRSSG